MASKTPALIRDNINILVSNPSSFNLTPLIHKTSLSLREEAVLNLILTKNGLISNIKMSSHSFLVIRLSPTLPYWLRCSLRLLFPSLLSSLPWLKVSLQLFSCLGLSPLVVSAFQVLTLAKCKTTFSAPWLCTEYCWRKSWVAVTTYFWSPQHSETLKAILWSFTKVHHLTFLKGIIHFSLSPNFPADIIFLSRWHCVMFHSEKLKLWGRNISTLTPQGLYFSSLYHLADIYNKNSTRRNGIMLKRSQTGVIISGYWEISFCSCFCLVL